jgi:hypothetical protein
MDQLGCKRYCCRRMIMTHVDLIEKLLKYVFFLRIDDLGPHKRYEDRFGRLTILIDTIPPNETRRRRQWAKWVTLRSAGVLHLDGNHERLHTWRIGEGVGGSWAWSPSKRITSQKNQDHFSPSVPIQPGIIPCTVPSVVIYAPSYLIFVPERYFSVSVLGLCASGTHFSSHGPEPRALDHTPPFESATTLKSCWNLLIIRFDGPDQHANMPTPGKTCLLLIFDRVVGAYASACA